MKPTENEMVSSRRKSHCKRVRQVSVEYVWYMSVWVCMCVVRVYM